MPFPYAALYHGIFSASALATDLTVRSRASPHRAKCCLPLFFLYFFWFKWKEKGLRLRSHLAMDIRHTPTSSHVTSPLTKSTERLSLWEIKCTKFLAVFEQFFSYVRINRGDL